MTLIDPDTPLRLAIPLGLTPDQLVALALSDGRRQYHKITPERAVVNCLRHEHTNYDETPTQAHHATINRAIAKAYPHLTEECARQVRARARKEGRRKVCAEHVTFWLDTGHTITVGINDPIPALDHATVLDTTHGLPGDQS